MSSASLTGFRDFFPEECAFRESLFTAWKTAASTFGFDLIDGPPLEPLDLFTKKSGPEIVSQLYNFQDKGGREVALRPEMTPTIARMIGARQRDFKKPLKWFSIPQVFRYEKPQKGRLREHYQWNCDIFGESGLGAEAELISLLAHSLKRLGLTPDDVTIRISDRLYWQEFFQLHQINEERAQEMLQVLDKIDRTPEDITREKLGSHADAVYAALASTDGGPRLRELFDLLHSMGTAPWCRVDLRIVRGLAYYTGIVFEAHDAQGQLRAIAGGGRYDGLVKTLTGVDIPALGFGMGDVVITELLKEKGLKPFRESCPQLYLAIGDESVRCDVLALATQLRETGMRIDYPLSAEKIGRQLQSAQDRGHTEALILDPQWRTSHLATRKHLTDRTECTVRLEWTATGCEFKLQPATSTL